MKILSALVASVMMLTLLVAAPAHAAKKPGRVGLITIESAGKTSLTFRWPREPRANRYVVERGTNTRMAHRKDIRTTKKNRVRVRGLRPGKLYCFTVRAKNGKGTGKRSHKACQYPSESRKQRKGATYRVLTYNTCASACGHWSKRRPRAAALVRRQKPAVVMLQETPPDSRMARAIGGMVQVKAHSGKALLYKKKRFKVAKNKHGKKRAGVLNLGKDRAGSRSPKRWAVWAELVDRRRGGKRVLFVSVHLAPGGDTKGADQKRRKNTRRLLAGIKRVNDHRRPVVIGGDLNTNQGRDHDSPTRLLKRKGLENAYFLARSWTRGNYNSATQNKVVPTVGTAWGYHVDQVWVNPRRVFVHKWVNANRIVRGKYPTPQISNHSPVLVKLRVS